MLYSQKPIKKTRLKPWMIVVGGLVLVALIMTVLEVTDTTHLFHKHADYGSGTIPSKISTTPTASTTKTSTNTATNTTTPQQPSDKSDTPPVASSDTPLTNPSGTLISNHTPGLNGSPTAITSQCVTLPGATCYIVLVKDGVTKKLDVQTAGTSGAVYWNWDVQTAGLTAGSWNVTAIASLGSQTKTTSDPINLQVQP
jgi:hypothetical protein